MSKASGEYRHPQAAELARRLSEPRRFVQVVAGPQQVGKSTQVRQVTDRLKGEVRYAGADEATLRGPEWIAQEWDAASHQRSAEDLAEEPSESDWAGRSLCRTRQRSERGTSQQPTR